jgi:cytochrome c553
MNTLRKAIVALCLAPALALAATSAKREFDAAVKATGDVARGAELYEQCISCHGSDASGQANGTVPRLAGQYEQVLLKQLVDFRYGKRWDYRMESLADRHHLEGARELADVAAYIVQLKPTGPRGLGKGEVLEEGARAYREHCEGCHGADGAGDEARLIPRLAGQHYEYLARQMYDAVDGRRPSMAKEHSRRVAPLDFEQIRAVADYLSRMAPTLP